MRLRWSVSLLVVAGCGGGGGFPDAPPAPDAAPKGTFSLAWSVVDAASQPLACDRIDAQAMTVLTRNIEFDGGSTQIFTCSGGTGTSQAVITGTYALNFELSSPAFGVLATAPEQSNVVVEAGKNTEIAPVTFQVDATGALALNLSAGQTGGNCAATAAMGANIDEMSIALTHASDGACEPLVLNVGPSALRGTGARTYTINCTAPVFAACIETDSLITATGVTADTYTIRVRGRNTGNDVCWSNNDSIQVPPLGKTLTRTLNFAPTGAAGCP